MTVFDQIINLLDAEGVEYRALEHEPVRTSEQAAEVRGTPLERGAKALVLDTGQGYVMAVISAARKVDFKALKQFLGTKRVQMARPEQVLEATGCEPGGVPPFGNLFGLRVLVDPSIAEQELIDFNAGERTRSIEMRADDYLRLVRAEIVPFAKPLR